MNNKAKFHILLAGLSLAVSVLGATQDGKVRFLKRQDPSFDPYTDNQSPVIQQWIRDKFPRMMEYSPYFDGKTSWYKSGLVYIDSYAIYKNSSDLKNHPDWILKDFNGNYLYIPYDCGGGTCPQYAADISNPNYRRAWIDNAKAILARASYAGLWIDDVNTNFSVSDGNGNFVNPRDPNSGAAMTWDAWRGYMASFMKQIRQELPNIEILQNSVWYAGPDGLRDKDTSIKAQIAAADYINIERGINDSGLTGGTGDWSVSAVFSYVDRLHAAGKGAVIDDFATDRTGREYALAGYFLVTNGNDRIGNQSMTPDNWWSGYEVDLGTPQGNRTTWNGLLRRDFANGMVLLSEPGSPSRTVIVPSGYKTLDGNTVSSITLNARQGAILTGTSALSITNVAVSGASVSTANISWTTDRQSDSKVEYGPTTSYGASSTSGTLAAAHILTLSNLAAGTTYHYRASSKDASGSSAVSGDFTFATASAPATSTTVAPLTVMNASPASGATQVAVGSSIGIGFSTVLSSSTVSGNVSVTKSGTPSAIAAQIAYDASQNMVNVTPTNFLDPSSSYQVTVKGGSGGVKASNGATLQKDMVWSFTTGATNTIYLSDLNTAYSINAWGPVEKDKSNGELQVNDGKTITLNGKTYSKGLGVHAYSEVRYQLNGACSSFSAFVGIDSEVPAGQGSVVFQVWADGQKLYESAKLTRDSAPPSVVVNITGRKQLSLVVADAGNGNGYDHADWAQAQIACGAKPPAMVDNSVGTLVWDSATNGWGPVERSLSNGERESRDGRPITINGTVFKTGIGAHADSEIRYSLGGSCTSFRATVGIDDEVPDGNGSVIFQIWSDGAKLFDSGVMKRGTAGKEINLPLDGTSQLSLVITTAGDGNGWDHADWGDATLTCSKALPIAP